MAMSSSRSTTAISGAGARCQFGQVYQTLGRLARDGKVTVGLAEPGAGPDRKRYTITAQGAEEFERWLATPVMPEPHLQTELFMKVVLAILVGRSAKAYLDSQRAAHLKRIRELTADEAIGDLDRHAAG